MQENSHTERTEQEVENDVSPNDGFCERNVPKMKWSTIGAFGIKKKMNADYILIL